MKLKVQFFILTFSLYLNRLWYNWTSLFLRKKFLIILLFLWNTSADLHLNYRNLHSFFLKILCVNCGLILPNVLQKRHKKFSFCIFLYQIFVLIRESYAFVRESYSFNRDSFAFIRENYNPPPKLIELIIHVFTM